MYVLTIQNYRMGRSASRICFGKQGSRCLRTACALFRCCSLKWKLGLWICKLSPESRFLFTRWCSFKRNCASKISTRGTSIMMERNCGVKHAKSKRSANSQWYFTAWLVIRSGYKIANFLYHYWFQLVRNLSVDLRNSCAIWRSTGNLWIIEELWSSRPCRNARSDKHRPNRASN